MMHDFVLSSVLNKRNGHMCQVLNLHSAHRIYIFFELPCRLLQMLSVVAGRLVWKIPQLQLVGPSCRPTSLSSQLSNVFAL